MGVSGENPGVRGLPGRKRPPGRLPLPGACHFPPDAPVVLFGDLMKKTAMTHNAGAAAKVSPLAGYLVCRGAVVSHLNLGAWRQGGAS